MLICSYFKVFLKYFLLPYVQNLNFSQTNKKINNNNNILLQQLTKIKIEYIWSKSHVIKDEVLCRLFKTILAD